MMVDKETWLDVDGYEGLYKVSSLGNVSTTRRQGTTGKPLKPILENTGYFSVRLCKYGHTKKYYVHRLVAAAFLGFYPLMQVNHKNEVRNDNRISNLEWVTPKNNCNYGNHNSRMAATNRGGKKWVIQYDLKGNKINCYKIYEMQHALLVGMQSTSAERHEELETGKQHMDMFGGMNNGSCKWQEIASFKKLESIDLREARGWKNQRCKRTER